MATFKNKSWSCKRDYECTNLVCCVGEQAPNENWAECESIELENLIEKGAQQLWIENNVRFYGWL